MKVVITTKNSKCYTKTGILTAIYRRASADVAVIKLTYPLHDGAKYAYIIKGGYVAL